MFDGNEPVARAMQDIRMARYILHPFIGFQFVPKHESQGEDRQEFLHGAGEIIVWCIQDQVAGFVLRGEFCGKTTTQAPAIYNDG